MTPKTPNRPTHDLEAAITRSLGQCPQHAIPPDFAARVLVSLPAQRTVPSPTHTGRTIAMVAAIILAVALFALAPHATPSFASLVFDIELILLAQLAVIAWLLTPSRSL